MNRDEIVWEDPPPRPKQPPSTNPKTVRLAAFVVALRQHEGKWARYPLTLGTDTSKKATASRIRRGNWQFGGGFEAEHRPVDGEVVVYVRFVGEPV